MFSVPKSEKAHQETKEIDVDEGTEKVIGSFLERMFNREDKDSSSP